MFWILATVIGLAATAGALFWSLRSHRAERAPWLELLARPAAAAAQVGSEGTLSGVVTAGEGALPPIQAPFSRRVCLGFTVDIVMREQFGNTTTWTRVYEGGDGRALLAGSDGTPLAEVEFRGARALFPTQVSAYSKYSATATPETVYQGTLQKAPPHLAAFVASLPPEVQQKLTRSSGSLIGGKRIFFNERIVIPGAPVVVAGRCLPGPRGISVGPGDGPVFVGHGTLESERARVSRLPIAGELFGAIMGGVLAFAMVMMVGAMAGKL